MQIKTAGLNTYAVDGKLCTSNTDAAFLRKRIVREVSTVNPWHEFNGIVAEPCLQNQRMILGNLFKDLIELFGVTLNNELTQLEKHLTSVCKKL